VTLLKHLEKFRAPDCLLASPNAKFPTVRQGLGAWSRAYAPSRRLWRWSAFHSPPSHRSFHPARRSFRPATSLAAHPAHLNVRDTTLAFVSRASQPNIARLKARMGWELIPWYTITDDFDKDFGVDEWHGTNAFIRDGDRVFRTYFINNRGDEAMGGTWAYLDITALGRQEKWEDSPEGYPQTAPYDWWIWHDQPRRTDPDRPGLVQLRAARSAAGQ
jgi:hypothetical protein